MSFNLIILFKYIILLLPIMVIFSTNLVYAVLSLIFIFLFISVMYIHLGAEFLGILLVIVYVGAIAVLFLFVVMMLPTRQSMLKNPYSFGALLVNSNLWGWVAIFISLLT